MLRIGVLASHEGTTLQSIIDACAQERISGHVVAVISNNSGSGALRRGAAAGLETFHSRPRRIPAATPSMRRSVGCFSERART